MTSTGGTLESTRDGKVSTGGFGAFALQDADLGLAVSLFTAAQPGGTPLRRIYGGFSLENISLSAPDGVTTRIGRVSGRDLAARPTTAGWIATLETLGKTGDLKSAPPDERAQRLTAMAELVDAFSFGSLEATAISFGATGREGGRIDRIALAGGTDTTGGEFHLEGLDVGGPSTRVRFASLTFGGVSLQPMLDGLRRAAQSQQDKLSPADLRRLVPRVGLVRLDGLEVDLPARAGADETVKPQPGHVAIGQAELEAGNPINGVPSGPEVRAPRRLLRGAGQSRRRLPAAIVRPRLR